MKRLLWLALIAAPLFAQPATTTVADQLYMAIGGPTYCQGTITLSWSDFYSEDGYMVKAGTLSTPVNSTGQFSVLLVPTNTNTTPASGIYNIRYNLQPAGCAATSESWNVPSGGGPVDLNNVRTLPSPPPSLIPVTSLAPPIGNAAGALCYNGMYVLWGTSCTSGGSAITGSGTTGKIAKFTGSTAIGNAAYADIVANWTGCTGSEYLGFDGNCHTPISQLTAAAIVALWSGCTGTQYLGADESCHTAGGSGTVTSVGLTMPSWLTVTGSPVTTSGAFAVAPTTAQTSHKVIGTCGTGTTFAPCSLVGGDLPLPTSSSLGGIESLASTAHEWINAISTSGVPSATQPACADLSTAAGGCSMSTTAGGDLSGTLPSPTVTNGSHITNASIPNSGLANPSMTVGGASCTLGGSCSPTGGAGFIQALTGPISANFTARNYNVGSGVTTTQVNISSPVTAITIHQQDPSNTKNLAALSKAEIAATFTTTIAVTIGGDMSAGLLSGLWLNDTGTNNLFFGIFTEGNFDGAILPELYIGSSTSFINGTANTIFVGANAGQFIPIGGLLWLRIKETASARNYYTSTDGVTFYLIYTESNTAHFTTASYGWAVQMDGTTSGGQYDSGITCYSFTESNP